MMAQSAWLACRFHNVPITSIGLPIDLAIRLYANGCPTVGSVDDLIGEYREKELQAMLGRKDYTLLMRTLSAFCRKRLLEATGFDNRLRATKTKEVLHG